jgi:DNA-3-methyladenine glycosylase II
MTMRRFRVAEDSMRPALAPGDEVVATDSRRPELGDLAVFPHPARADFWMIKRVAEPSSPVGPDQLWVMSDSAGPGTVDSRALGPIEASKALRVVDRLDADTFAEACELLASEDGALTAALASHGVPEFWYRQPGFKTLVWLILEQQVSLESGAAMYRRLAATAGKVSPQALSSLGVGRMRDIGVTRQKASYLEGIALAIVAGEFDLERLDMEPWQVARERLLSLNGVGPWTADAYLLSALRFPDMFPVGDRALQVGTAEVLALSAIPNEEELAILGKPWRPVRAVAARIIWHAYLSERDRIEPPDPTITT